MLESLTSIRTGAALACGSPQRIESIGSDARDRLKEDQTRFLEMLVAAGSPEGFDESRVRALRESLARKRARAAARAWPSLFERDKCHDDTFESYAGENELPPGGDPTDDGRAFARWLEARGQLATEGKLAALAFDLARGERRVGLVRASLERRLVIGARLPGFGSFWLRIPCL